MAIHELEVFGLVGETGFQRLVSAFYRRVTKDDLLGPMYPKEDMQGAEDRLRGFLIQRFGGPTNYSEQRGHPRLRMRHAPFPIGQAARDRWIALMNEALDETQFNEEITAILRRYFADTATFMINRPG